MKARALIAAALLCTGSTVADDVVEPSPPPAFPEVLTETFDGGRRIDLHAVPLVGWAAPRTADGGRPLLLLTHPPDDDGPCNDRTLIDAALYRLEFDRAEPVLTLLRDDLPGDATGLDALDVDGDGTEELLLFRPGQILVLVDGVFESLVADEALSHDSLAPMLVRDRVPLDAPWLQVPGIGTVRFYRPAAESGPWALAAESKVTLEAFRTRDGFYLHSPPPVLLGRGSDGKLVYAGMLEVVDRQRLKVSLVRPESGELEECWARLPAPEIPIRRMPALLNGEPVLLVTARPADDFGLFDEQLLRIFPLKRDRSRAGRPPLVAFKARPNLILNVVPGLLDMNDDGRQDLVLGYWKGFDQDHVVLDVYLQEAGGTFPDTPRSTAFKVKGADPSVLSFDRDLDGDGRLDLLLVAAGKLLVYRGSATGNRWVEKSPTFSVPLGDAAGDQDDEVVMMAGPDGVTTTVSGEPTSPQAIDLDGDGRSEVLIFRTGKKGVVSINLVFFSDERAGR